MPRSSPIELARGTALFRDVGEAVMARLLRNSIVQVLPKGAVLFEEGEEAGFVHLIVSGSIGLTASSGRPESTVVEIFRDGELFVAPAAVLRLPYLVSAVVLAEARILFIPADAFRAALETEPRFSLAMVQVLARHWRLLVNQIKDLKLRHAAERLASFLVVQSGAQPSPAALTLREPRAMLAARLGMTPESLSRAFAQLEAEGVTAEGRQVRIADVEALRRYCGFDGLL